MSDPLRYALVAYVRKPVGEFVERLRRELHPNSLIWQPISRFFPAYSAKTPNWRRAKFWKRSAVRLNLSK